MPIKPTKEVIEASKHVMDPRDVIRAIFNEVPELGRAAVEAGVMHEVKKED